MSKKIIIPVELYIRDLYRVYVECDENTTNDEAAALARQMALCGEVDHTMLAADQEIEYDDVQIAFVDDEAAWTEEEEQEMKARITAMYNIRVHYDNGDSITTRINANVSEIVNYYLDKPMYGVDLSARARCVEFLDGPALRYRPNTTILRRVYSLSDAVMQRCNLYNRFRFTADVYDRFSPVPIDREDAAYISGMFDRA